MKEPSDGRLKEVVARRLEFFRRKPEAAVYKPKVTSHHVRGLYTESLAREHVVKSDYGEAAGGTNLAPNPIELLLSALAACPAPVTVVSNEVGWGIVPENALARRFRDAQGRLNQQIAAQAELVIGVMAGLPMVLKGERPEWL